MPAHEDNMSKYAFQHATGFLDVEKLNTALRELADSQDADHPKLQLLLSRTQSPWAAGQSLYVPRKLCYGLEEALPMHVSMSFEYHDHDWDVVKYVHTKELALAAAYLHRKQAVTDNSKGPTAGDSSPPAVEVGTKCHEATAGGTVLGPYEGHLAAHRCRKYTRFKIKDLHLRRTGRHGDNALFVRPAKQAAWEKEVLPAAAGKVAVNIRLHLWQLQEEELKQHVAQQQQQQQQLLQKKKEKEQQQKQKATATKRAGEPYEVSECHMPAVKRAKTGKTDQSHSEQTTAQMTDADKEGCLIIRPYHIKCRRLDVPKLIGHQLALHHSNSVPCSVPLELLVEGVPVASNKCSSSNSSSGSMPAAAEVELRSYRGQYRLHGIGATGLCSRQYLGRRVKMSAADGKLIVDIMPAADADRPAGSIGPVCHEQQVCPQQQAIDLISCSGDDSQNHTTDDSTDNSNDDSHHCSQDDSQDDSFDCSEDCSLSSSQDDSQSDTVSNADSRGCSSYGADDDYSPGSDEDLSDEDYTADPDEDSSKYAAWWEHARLMS